MKIAITLDLSDLQVQSLKALADRYPHGWHTADLIIRKDAIELRYEADWALQLARAVKTLS